MSVGSGGKGRKRHSGQRGQCEQIPEGKHREEQELKLDEGKALSARLRGVDRIWEAFMDGSGAKAGVIRSELLGAESISHGGPDPLLHSCPFHPGLPLVPTGPSPFSSAQTGLEFSNRNVY